MKAIALSLFFSVFAFTLLPHSAFASDADPIIRNVIDRLKQDLTTMHEYGAHQRVVTTRLSEKGTPRRIEEKNLRTVWIHDKPKIELIHFTCNEIQNSGKIRSCSGVEKANYQKDPKPGKIEAEVKKIRWSEMYRNFNYTLLPPDGPYFVVSFSPKERATPSNRIEKILSRMAGKVWVDRQFNIVRAEAKLVNTVSFGFGIAAKIHHLAIQYTQQPYRSVWLPAALTVNFKAKVALVHTERQRIEVFWTGPYRKSDTVWAQAGSVSTITGSSRR